MPLRSSVERESRWGRGPGKDGATGTAARPSPPGSSSGSMPAPEWGQGRSRAHRQGGNPGRNRGCGGIARSGIRPGKCLRAGPCGSTEAPEHDLQRGTQQDRCKLPDAHAQQHVAGQVLSARCRIAVGGRRGDGCSTGSEHQ